MIIFHWLESDFFSIIEITFIFSVLSIALTEDIKTRKISNKISYSALLVSIFYFLIFKEFDLFLQHLLGFLIVFILGLILFYFQMMGGGDIKILSFLGFIFPLYSLFTLFLFIILFGGIQGVWGTLKKEKKIPYALSIFGGTFFYVFFSFLL